MKRIVILLSTLFALCACEDNHSIHYILDYDYKVIEIDSCEYIYRRQGSRGYLAHKGNCKYCRERDRKMIKDILLVIDYE